MAVAAGLATACGGSGANGVGPADSGPGAETAAAEAGADAHPGDSGGADSGAPGGAVICTTPGNAGSTGHGCNFLLSPNVSYPNAASNNDPALPKVTPPAPPDGYAPHGDADPCTRQDPSSANLYMTYTQTSGGNLSTDMAYSTNGGADWAAASASVWPGVGGVKDPYTPHASASLGVINSETSNLAFRAVPGGVVVYGIHELYWLADGGKVDAATRHYEIVEVYLPAGSSPEALRAALGSASNGAPNVGTIQSYPGTTACPGPQCTMPGPAPLDLTQGTSLTDCGWLHEPALRWQPADGALYLALECTSTATPQNNRIVVFGTTSPADDAAVDGGTGSPASWTWTYQGSFLPEAAPQGMPDATTAAEAYGFHAQSTPYYFTQGEIATARDGSLLYLASLVHLVGDAESRDAVYVFQIGSLSQATLSAPLTPTPGAPPYAAVVEMKLAINGGDDGQGPGSSTYDPGLTAAGVVYAGRTFPGLDAGVTGFETDLFSFPTVAP